MSQWEVNHAKRGTPPATSLHDGPVACVDMRSDGLLASGGYDGTVGIWSAAGRRRARLCGHSALVNGVAWSPDGRRIASASSDHSVMVWDAERERAEHRLEGHRDDVNAVAWSPDGRWVVTGSFDGTARVFDVESGRFATELLGHRRDVNGVAWSPDGTRIATASDDRTARLWSPLGAVLRELRGHGDWVDAVAFSPGGRLLATASLDRTARVFDARTGRPVACLRGHGCTVKAVRFSPDGRFLATAAYDKRIRLFDVSSWQVIAEFFDARMWNRSLAWGRRGRIATGSFGGAPVQWRIGDDRGLTVDPIGKPGINGMALSPCGSRVALGCDDGGARIVRLYDGRILRERLDHDGAVLSAAWSPDGRLVAFGGWNDRVSIHEAETGQVVTWIDGIQEPVNALAFGQDGETLAAASFMGTLSLWSAQDGRHLGIAGTHEGSIKSVAPLPTRRGWVTGGRDGCVRLHAGSDSRAFRLGPTIVNGVAVSPDGRRIAAATRGEGVVVLDAEDGGRCASLCVHPVSARSVAVSEDGRHLAAGYYDGHLLLASLEGGTQRLCRPFGPTPISSVAFAAKGRLLAVSTWDAYGRFGIIDVQNMRLRMQGALRGGTP